MEILAFIIGIIAVCLYFLGYLQRRKRAIMLLNLSSRVLYIVQYMLLGAFSGAALDVAGAIGTVIAGRQEMSFIKKHKVLVICAMNALIVGVGIYVMIATSDPLGVLPIIGVACHVNAFWFGDEKNVRRLSMLGSPFWLAYNILSGAYGSCIGDVLSMVSIGAAMIKYDVKKGNG